MSFFNIVFAVQRFSSSNPHSKLQFTYGQRQGMKLPPHFRQYVTDTHFHCRDGSSHLLTKPWELLFHHIYQVISIVLKDET